MKLEKDMKWNENATKSGGSIVFVLTPEIREYLGCEKDQDGYVQITAMAAEGKHGRYIAIYKSKEKSI